MKRRHFLAGVGGALTAAAAWPAAGRGLAPALGDRRVAIVIGNDSYRHGPSLRNPVRDARAVAALLRDLGYRVYLGENLDLRAFQAAIAGIPGKVAGAGLALVYYAGHGVQIDGGTYLLPTDARMESRADLDTAVTLNELLDALRHDLRASVVLVDSCRNNPIYESTVRSFNLSPGAGFDGPSAGMFIGYASQPGEVAYDGAGPHSPFSQAVLDHLPEPGIDVETMMRRVRLATLRATDGRQVPWSQSSLLGPVYLAGPPALPDAAEPGRPSADAGQAGVPAGTGDSATAPPTLAESAQHSAGGGADGGIGAPMPAPMPAVVSPAPTAAPDRAELLARICAALGSGVAACQGVSGAAARR